MEIEDQEQEILLSPEEIIIAPVTSVNGKTGDVVLTTSDLENDSNYQNANDVATAISNHNQSASAHQDIRQAISDEATARINADNGLQGQIDAITSSSDVVDIVGTYAELQAYDTQNLKDNDVVKVLQDETHNDAMTYYRWSTATETWTYIGAEGPYYTKSETNTLLDEKLDVDEVPDGFFDGPATIMPTPSTSVEIEDSIKLKSIDLLGDTTQQTYSGKNLWKPAPNGTYTQGGITSVCTNGTIISTGTSTTTSAGTSAFYDLDTPLPAGTYTFSIKNALPYRVEFVMQDSGGTNHFPAITAGSTSNTVTTTWETVKIRNGFGGYAVGTEIDITIDEFQLEVGSTTTSYEPYVGGTPAPNPDYPQTVNVVTGTQTVTLGDGTITEDYTIDLGSIELCKISNYQDYIYKSGDNWYVHKGIYKLVLTGSEDETWIRQITGGDYSTAWFQYTLTENAIDDFSTRQLEVCNNFVNIGSINYSQTTEGFAHNVVSNLRFRYNMSTIQSLANWRVWLSTHNIIVYYVLATPTDTKITDTVLIGQLNALLNATIYSPTTTIISSGNLPAILSVEAFTDNLNSLLEIASEPTPEPVTYNDFVGTDGVNAGVAGLVPAPATTDAGKFLKADGTWDTAGGTVVQTTGTSQTDVMSQNAVSSMVFADPGTASKVQIGSSAAATGNTSISIGKGSKAEAVNATAIGTNADAKQQSGTAVGYYAKTYGEGSVAIGESAYGGTSNSTLRALAIGSNASANAKGAVAIGAYANKQGQRVGEIFVGTTASQTAYGFNSTQYRLINGVYDGQDAHDAATVGQVNATIDAINAALSTNIPHIGA